MRLLLTGATGFVGRNVLLRALAGGYDVHVPVRSAEKLQAQLRFEQADAARVHPLPADPARWPALAPDHAILGAGVLFARNRAEYFSTNVDWTMRVLAALPQSCRVAFLSSQSAGGPTPPGKAAREASDPDAPITWYGESKLAAEKAIRASGRPAAILRPPMVLGPRDAATLPLFRMARGPVRLKPGWRTKSYSFIAVDDLAEALFTVLRVPAPLPEENFYVASPEIISDLGLIAAAAAAGRWRGVTLPLPQVTVRLLSLLVDAIPPLRNRTPSLTRDRAREISPDRWVVDGAPFSRATGWQARRSLQETMQATHDYYVREGAL